MSQDQDMLLAKLPIPEGWVDMGIGESSILYGNALTLLSKKIIKIPTNLNLKYLPPAGYPPLVKTLESKYKLPAIVTVGAKQGLLASFLTLKRLGVTHIVTTRPYWTSFPTMCELCGLSFSAYDSWETLDSIVETTKIAYLVVSPNNPDGSTAGPNLIDRLKSRGHYVIHDAAYESKAYGFDLTNYNYDIKIYSSSKQLGMSSSRVGWMLVKNRELFNPLLDTVETLSSGSGVADQHLVYNLLVALEDSQAGADFINMSWDMIGSRRKAFLLNLSDRLFTQESISDALLNQSGIFIWLEKKVEFTQEDVSVRFIDGKNFGMPTHIRLCIGNLPVLECLDVSRRFA